MTPAGFAEHLQYPRGQDHLPPGASTGHAGGAPCGDLVRFSVRVDDDRVGDAGFAVAGCGAVTAAASAAVALIRNASVLSAASVGAEQISAELGGLSLGKRHAAELVADALARALGTSLAVRGRLEPSPHRTLVALSGGVDSAVAALLCAEQGDEVVAVTLELWADSDHDGSRSCCSAAAVRGARALAGRLGFAHLTLDLRDAFRAGVVEPYLQAHTVGETPNPCVNCNGQVRLDAMIELAGRLGATCLATGHYARRVDDGEGRALLRTAADPAKDQSYMLCALAPVALGRLRFPLGELTKGQVRSIARAAGLPVADRPESQDLCFLAGTERGSFLARHGRLESDPGPIVDRSGQVLGRHRGYHRFTVGQRRGIGIGGGTPLYVLETDASTNRVVVGERGELCTTDVSLRGCTLRRDAVAIDSVRLRYHSRAIACRLDGTLTAGRHRDLQVELAEPVLGVAPGQTACLMAGELVVGWGTIGRP